MISNRFDLSVVWATCSVSMRGLYTNKHSHNLFHLTYRYKGRISTDTTNMDKTISILPPGVEHGYDEVYEDAYYFELKFVVWDQSLYHALIKLGMAPIPVDDNTIAFIEMLSEDIRTGTPDHSTLNAACSFLLHRLIDKQQSGATLSASDKIVSYIEENFTAPITLNSIAEHVGFSPNYTSTLFHKEIGMTISSYINQVRIRHACSLIAYTNIPISQVMTECGFNEMRNFGRVFKDLMGITPMQYRHSYRVSNVFFRGNVDSLRNVKPDIPLYTYAVCAQKRIDWPDFCSYVHQSLSL